MNRSSIFEMGGSVAKEKLSSLTEQIHLPHGAVSFHCAMLGLDSAGKTTALYRLKFGQYMNAAPTIGFNCEKVRERHPVWFVRNALIRNNSSFLSLL